MISPPLIPLLEQAVFAPPGNAARRAHLIGAAGAGMQSLAELLRQAGWQVSGSDIADCDAASENVSSQRCANRAAFRWSVGHDSAHLDDQTTWVVYSDAVGEGNPERLRAGRLGIPTLNYPAAIGQLMCNRRGLAVAGTHGKSTCAAMLAEILETAGDDPSYLFGARRQDGRPGGRHGHGRWLIAEACEYRENFRLLRPELGVLLNIEPDHFDYYRNQGELDRAFASFARSLPSHGKLIYCTDCPRTRRAAEHTPAAAISFGCDEQADWRAVPVGHDRDSWSFDIQRHGLPVMHVELRVPGRHNILNALAAAVAAHQTGASDRQICAGLHAFGGLQRRLETKIDRPDLAVIDDYAHLPGEVAAGLLSVRRRYPGRRLSCVLEPHQASRTAALLEEFAHSLRLADRVVVAKVVRAREGVPQTGEVDAASLVARVQSLGGHAAVGPEYSEILRQIEAGLQAGDVIVTMGAGTIGKLANAFAQRF